MVRKEAKRNNSRDSHEGSVRHRIDITRSTSRDRNKEWVMFPLQLTFEKVRNFDGRKTNTLAFALSQNSPDPKSKASANAGAKKSPEKNDARSSKPSPAWAPMFRQAPIASALLDFISESNLEGRPGEVESFLKTNGQGIPDNYRNLTVIGIGGKRHCYAQNLLSWAGQLAVELRKHKITEIDLAIDSFHNVDSKTRSEDLPKDNAGRPILSHINSLEETLECVLMGMSLALYTFDRYQTKSDQKTYELKINVLSQHLAASVGKKIEEKVKIVSETIYFTRDLKTLPANDLHPAELAKEAQAFGKKMGFAVTVWDEKKLAQENMNGVLSVGKGSAQPPRFIICEYNKNAKGPTIVLVGKAVTFDTGGVSLKPAQGMHEMKMDMSGGASVIGAIGALAKLKVPCHVVALIPAAENMNSGSAIRPGDIYRAANGKTVEVLNTDAEGRLILADALHYAKRYNPDCVIDVATLTGACIIALGHSASAILGNNHVMIDGFRKASSKVGEKTWELPIYDAFRDDLKSPIADIQNIGKTARAGGTAVAAAFLDFFVENAYPWIHLDVAGTADTPSGQGHHCPPYVGTGVPVRAIVEFVSGFKGYSKK